MSPFEHGEVFVLDDGGEVRDGWGVRAHCHHNTPYTTQVDLDLGNYERFLDITLRKDNNLTTGKIYQVSSIVSSTPVSLHTHHSSPRTACD